MKKVKWTDAGLKSYKSAGEEVRSHGAKAIREIQDPDCNSVLTMWAMRDGSMIITQTFCDTGDVCHYAPMKFTEEYGAR